MIIKPTPAYAVHDIKPFDRNAIRSDGTRTPPVGDDYVLRFERAPNGDIFQLTPEDYLNYGFVMINNHGRPCLPNGV